MPENFKKGAQDDTDYPQRAYHHRPTSQLVSILDRPYESVWTLPQVANMCQGKYATYWKGAPLLKDPFAMQMYTQMIQRIQPRTIFDLGTAMGGSALFFADLLQVLGPPGAIVLSVDIQDNRSPDIVAAMDAHPCIQFVEGDAVDFGALVKVLRQRNSGESSHPWIVTEDCHVDSYAVASQVRLYGEPGDYLVFEDTQEFGPNVAGMSAADMDQYRTGFGREKYTGVLEAMALFTPEFLVDTEYTDAFGYNGTMQVNGVFVLYEPAETANTVTYSIASDIQANVMKDQLHQHGHVLFRAAHDMERLPFEEIQEALALVDINDYRLGTQTRSKAEGDPTGKFVGVTKFDGTQAIYSHHELSYAPNPPTRLVFLCAKVAEVGGETTIFDGVQAWKELAPALRQKIQDSPVVYRRQFFSTHNMQASGQFLGKSWQDAFKVEELAQAIAEAESVGYTVIEANDEDQVLTTEFTQFLVHKTPCGTALFSSAHGNNAWAYRRMNGSSPMTSIYWKSTGEEVSDEESRELAIAYAKARKCFQWKNRGDFVVLDNRWFAHGRSPFLGPRLVHVTIGNTADDMKETTS